jgi:hypothetical protein
MIINNRRKDKRLVFIYILYKKGKFSRYRPEQAHGRSGRLRPRIVLTFGTRRW